MGARAHSLGPLRRRILEWLDKEPSCPPIPPGDPEEMGRRINEHMLVLGIDRCQLAKRFGLHPATITHWVRGGTPLSPTQVRILQWLDEEPKGPALWPWDSAQMGQRIIERLQELGTSRRDFGKHFGVHPGLLDKWNRGVIPSPELRRRILEWLDEEPTNQLVDSWNGLKMGQRISEHRLQLGMTVTTLANRLRVCAVTVRKWELGRTPCEANQTRISDWLAEETPAGSSDIGSSPRPCQCTRSSLQMAFRSRTLQ